MRHILKLDFFSELPWARVVNWFSVISSHSRSNSEESQLDSDFSFWFGLLQRLELGGWGCSQLGERLPRLRKATGSIPPELHKRCINGMAACIFSLSPQDKEFCVPLDYRATSRPAWAAWDPGIYKQIFSFSPMTFPFMMGNFNIS